MTIIGCGKAVFLQRWVRGTQWSLGLQDLGSSAPVLCAGPGHTVLLQHNGRQSCLRPPGPSPSPSNRRTGFQQEGQAQRELRPLWVLLGGRLLALQARPPAPAPPSAQPSPAGAQMSSQVPMHQGLLHTSAQSWEAHSGTQRDCILSQSGGGGNSRTGQGAPTLTSPSGHSQGRTRPHSAHPAPALPLKAPRQFPPGAASLPFPSLPVC